MKSLKCAHPTSTCIDSSYKDGIFMMGFWNVYNVLSPSLCISFACSSDLVTRLCGLRHMFRLENSGARYIFRRRRWFG